MFPLNFGRDKVGEGVSDDKTCDGWRAQDERERRRTTYDYRVRVRGTGSNGLSSCFVVG